MATIKNNHRHFKIMFQKKNPLNTKQNPKKNASSPRKKPCHVIAYISYGFGSTNNTSTMKAAMTRSRPKGLLKHFFILYLLIVLLPLNVLKPFLLPKKLYQRHLHPGLSGIHICCRKVLPSIVIFIVCQIAHVDSDL